MQKRGGELGHVALKPGYPAEEQAQPIRRLRFSSPAHREEFKMKNVKWLARFECTGSRKAALFFGMDLKLEFSG